MSENMPHMGKNMVSEVAGLLETLGFDATIDHYRALDPENTQRLGGRVFGIVLMFEKQKQRQAEQLTNVPEQIDLTGQVILPLEDRLPEPLSS